jgi:UDP-N-acetylglucosamine 2-epimerase (non-hydrolysing)
MTKIMTILVTRPEIIRLSQIIWRLDDLCKHVVVHTGQNYDPCLNEVFFKELDVREPDYYLGAKGTLGEQLGIMFPMIEKIINEECPDKVLVLGDTNSGLCAIVAERMGVPVYHMEAGNRCFDKRVPEEVNRRLIDSISTYNLPYTPGSASNLIKNGVPGKRIFVCGNPIAEVLMCYQDQIAASDILDRLKLEEDAYFLATFHRSETVDFKDRLAEILGGLSRVAAKHHLPVICSVHPRTKERIKRFGLEDGEGVRFLDAMGFFDFVNLEKNSKCILTDSGTVSEEACILSKPCVIIRDTTERPEILECGAAVLSGVSAKSILDCTRIVLQHEAEWALPEGYNIANVSDRVVRFLLGAQK